MSVATELPQQVVYRAIGDALSAASSNFANRIRSGFYPKSDAGEDQIYPYVVMVIVGGGDANIRKHRDASINVQVVCYSDNEAESLAGALVIDNTLDGKGSQESDVSERLDGGTWDITSVTAGRVVSRPEFYKNSKTVFANGKVYTLTLEEQ